jgi:hypothetical protein
MSYLEQLQSLIGRPSPPSIASYPVSEAMIHHWCEALGDANPIYTDSAAAERAGHRGVVAPPTMLQAWNMPGLVADREPPGADMVRIFEDAGFFGVVATNCDQEYVRYLGPGDLVSATHTLSAVSDLKATALGEGHFVTQTWTIRDADDEIVGTMLFRMLFFRPAATPVRHHPRPRPAMTRDTEFFWMGVERGQLLIQKCGGCGALRHPPGPMCPQCQSLAWEPIASAGRGAIYSFVRHYHPHIPPFEPGHPVALIALDEGVRMVSDIVGTDGADLEIGQRVEVEFNQVDDGLVLPQFRRVGHA